MINVSNEFRGAVLKNRTFFCKVNFLFRDGSAREVTNEGLMSNGWQFTDSSSGSGSFDIGATIINTFTARLDNTDESFSSCDFDGAVVVPYIGLQLDETRVEWICRGSYIVDTAQTSGNVITVKAYDNMSRFDRTYDSTLVYPASLGAILRDCCTKCGVALAISSFDMDAYQVAARPDDDALTYRDVLHAVAEISGSFARCNTQGALELRWYSTGVFEGEDSLDGGNFDRSGSSAYPSGDVADGGDFINYSTGASYDGGTFEAFKQYHHLHTLSSQAICTDDVVITGIRVKGDEAEYLAGNEGYVLEVADNPLISNTNLQTVAAHLYKKIGGMRFRPLKVSCLSDPSIEAGDPAYVTDRKGNVYPCYLTNIQYIVGSYMQVSCDAKTPESNRATQYSEATKAVVAARKNTERQLSSYDIAVQQLTSLITNSFGAYKTEDKQDDGSVVYYLHDKPTLEESLSVWRMAGNVFSVSSDGGKTWSAGMDSSGHAVLNMLSVIGIDAEWVNVEDLRAFKATIGGWKINERAIYRDYVTGTTIYRVYIQSPRSATDWVFSSQISTDSGKTFKGSFYVRADGYCYGNDIHIAGGTVNISTQAESFSAININWGEYQSNVYGGTFKVSRPSSGWEGMMAVVGTSAENGISFRSKKNGETMSELIAMDSYSQFLIKNGDSSVSMRAMSGASYAAVENANGYIRLSTTDGNPTMSMKQGAESVTMDYDAFHNASLS